jgi:hypothetical protein
VAQRISVAVQLSMAQEAAEALGLSVAADPSSCAVRGSPDGPLDLVAHRLSWRRCAGGNTGV